MSCSSHRASSAWLTLAGGLLALGVTAPDDSDSNAAPYGGVGDPALLLPGAREVPAPGSPEACRARRAALAAVANSELPLAFALTDPATFRTGAVLAARAGGDADRLFTALCHGGAEAAGVSDQVGRLAGGLDADFVLWSGHPLDLTSELQAVYIDGVHVDRKGNDQ